MRLFLPCAILAFLGWTNSAFAQPNRGITTGSGEKIVHLRDLPPDLQAQLRQTTKHDLALGFCYCHHFAFAEGFDLWTSDGRYVLFEGDLYYPVTDEELAQLIGKEEFAALGKPLAYRIPLGWIAVLGFIAVIAVCGYLSAQARALRLANRNSYQEAVQVYVDHLPKDAPPSSDDKQKALAAAVEFLQQTHGISTAKAEANVRLILAESDRVQSYELRQQAVDHEENGQWDLAIELYAQAAALRQEWDQKDHAFLLKCIQRVRDKQLRSGKAQPS